MNAESFEFALSQYIDGTLADAERAEVEERLRSDPAARALLEEYRRVDAAIRAGGAALPGVRWDRLAENISQAIDDQTARPVWFIGYARLAIAASVLFVAGLMGVHFLHSRGPAVNATARAEISVVGPQAEVAAGPAEVDISIGRPQEQDAAAGYAADSVLVQRPMVALDGFTQDGGGQVR